MLGLFFSFYCPSKCALLTSSITGSVQLLAFCKLDYLKLAGAGTFPHHKYFNASEQFPPRGIPENFLPAMLAGLLGIGAIDVVYADADDVCILLSIKGYFIIRNSFVTMLIISAFVAVHFQLMAVLFCELFAVKVAIEESYSDHRIVNLTDGF